MYSPSTFRPATSTELVKLFSAATHLKSAQQTVVEDPDEALRGTRRGYQAAYSKLAASAAYSTFRSPTATATAKQACETHLAEQELELAKMRQTTIVKGLRGRCSALRDCGWKWEEMAKDALRALESYIYMSFAQMDIGECGVRASLVLFICRLNTINLLCS